MGSTPDGGIDDHDEPADPEPNLVRAVDDWFAQNTGLGGCSNKDVAELAALFYGVVFDGGRESVEDALTIVESFGPGIQGLNDTFARQVLLASEVKRLRAALASKPVAPPAREALKWPVWQPEHYGTCPARNTPKGECNCYVALSATPPAQAMQDREDEAIYEVRSISFWSGCLTLKRINGDKEVPQSMESGMTVTLRAARTRGDGVEP